MAQETCAFRFKVGDWVKHILEGRLGVGRIVEVHTKLTRIPLYTVQFGDGRIPLSQRWLREATIEEVALYLGSTAHG